MEKPQASRFLCLSLIALGTVALSITAVMNAYFGKSLAVSAEGQLLQASSSLTVDAMAAALAAVTGLLFRSRRPLLGLIVGGFTLAFACYTFTSVVGFGATERVGKSRIVEAQQAEQVRVARETTERAVQQRREQLDWIRATVAKSEMRAERQMLIAEANKLVVEPIPVKEVPTDKVLADAQATVLSQLSGLGFESVQIGVIVGLAGLLIVAKMLGFALGAALWPLKASVAPAAGKAADAPVAVSEPVLAAPAAEPVKPTVVELDRDRVLALIKQWRREAIRSAPPSVAVRAEDVYRWFSDYARERGVTTVTMTQFGRLAAEVGLVKQKTTKHTLYRGIAKIERTPTLAIAA